MKRFYESKRIASLYVKYRPSFPEVLPCILKYASRRKIVQPFEHVLDVGCGSGQATKLFAPYAKRITGLDPSLNQIKEASKTNSLNNISYKLGTAEDIPFQNKSIDIVNCTAAIHCINYQRFLKECDRVVKPNGFITLSSYNFPPEIVKVGKSNSGDEKIYLQKKTNDAFSDVTRINHSQPESVIWRSKYKSLFSILPSKEKKYHTFKVRRTCSIEQFQYLLYSLDTIDEDMNKRVKIYKDKNEGKISEEVLKQLDPSEKLVTEIKSIWGVEGENSDIYLDIDWDVFVLLSFRPLI